jgi:hypothetical protein
VPEKPKPDWWARTHHQTRTQGCFASKSIPAKQADITIGFLESLDATTLSLDVLEILVHTRRPMPNSWPLFVADVPDRSIEKLPPVPQNWDAHPPSASSREAGDKWLQSKGSVGLLVPNLIIPQESNCLLNPAHPDFSLDWVEGPLDFPPDP